MCRCWGLCPSLGQGDWWQEETESLCTGGKVSFSLIFLFLFIIIIYFFKGAELGGIEVLPV